MKKKIYYLVLALLCTAGVYAAKTDGPKGAHPWKVSENTNGVSSQYAHWTIALDAGFNSFDGDFGSEMKHPVWVPTVGLALEYNFTPCWTLGIEGVFDMYRVTGLDDNQNAPILLDGMMARGQAYLAFDLMSACYPIAKRKIFGLDLIAGGGAGWFKNSTYFPDETRHHTATSTALSDSTFSKPYPFVVAGVLFSFNLGRVTSLGIKGTYSYYIKDVIDGRGTASSASKNNDGIFDISLNLRFKLESIGKTHVKNIASFDATDRHFNTRKVQKDTVVFSHTDTLYVIQESSTATAGAVTYQPYEYAFIYFDHDDNDLNDKALIDIQQLATRLKEQKDLCIEIIGYADNTGTDEYNINLGYARAKNIRDELVEEHFISGDRIAYSSGGIIRGGRSDGAYSPNRRADIKIMQCNGEFKTVMQENEERNAIVKAAQDQAMAERENGVITAPEGLTLSGIARKYYGNPFCWVFIYEANKTTIKNPNILPPKTRLVIPDLTIQQMTISKKRAEAYYEKIK